MSARNGATLVSLPHSAARVQGDFTVNVWMDLEVQQLGPPLLGARLARYLLGVTRVGNEDALRPSCSDEEHEIQSKD